MRNDKPINAFHKQQFSHVPVDIFRQIILLQVNNVTNNQILEGGGEEGGARERRMRNGRRRKTITVSYLLQ